VLLRVVHNSVPGDEDMSVRPNLHADARHPDECLPIGHSAQHCDTATRTLPLIPLQRRNSASHSPILLKDARAACPEGA
jgi:hypothetical protein